MHAHLYRGFLCLFLKPEKLNFYLSLVRLILWKNKCDF